MVNNIFDRQLLKHNLNRFSKKFDQSNFLFHEIEDRLVEDIANFKQNFDNSLIINSKDGYLGNKLIDSFVKKSISHQAALDANSYGERSPAHSRGHKNVISHQAALDANSYGERSPAHSRGHPNEKTSFFHLVQTNLVNAFGLENQIIIDDEDLKLDKKFDLIINNLNLQFNNNVPKVLNSNKKLLKEKGLLICQFFGGQTLKELRDVFNKIELELFGGISPRVIPFIDIKDAGKLAHSAGLKNIICDSQIIEVSYSSLLKLFQDLRNMSLSNILFARNKRSINKKMLFLMEKLIKELYSDEQNSFVTSFEVITITSLND